MKQDQERHVIVTLHLPAGLWNRIQREARQTDTPSSQIVQRVMQARYKQPKKATSGISAQRRGTQP